MSAVVLFTAYGLVTALVWIGAAFKVRDLRKHPTNRSLRALMWTLVSLGFALPMVLIGPWADTLHGVEGMTSTAWHVLTLWAGCQFSAFLLWSSYPPEQARPRVRARVVTWLATSGVIGVAYVAADLPDRAHSFRVVDFGWQSMMWQLAFLAGLGLAMLDGSILALRFARMADPRALRIGLRMISVGTACGLGFCIAKILTAAAQSTDVGPVVPGSVLVLLVASTVLWCLLGVIYPAADARIRAIPRWLARRRRHDELYGLWHDLRREFPVLVVGRVPSSRLTDALRGRHLHWRYYRRVIECYDMLLHLRPWFSAQVHDHARTDAVSRGATSEQARALAEAAMIEAALRDRKAGVTRSDAAPVEHGGEESDLDSAADWLVHVQRSRAAVGAVVSEPA